MSKEKVGQQKTWSVGTLTYTFGGLVVLFAWLIGGDFLENMKERGMTPVLQLLLRRFEASNFLIGLLLGSLPTAIGMLIAPIVCMKSDRLRSRWGRRIPFLGIPLPISVLSMIGIAFAPALGALIHEVLGPSSPGLNMCSLLVFIAMWSIYDIASTVSTSVFGGLVNDVVPQAVIGRFYAFFRAGSLLMGMIYNYFLIGSAETHFFWQLIAMALLYGLGYGAICLKVKEGTYPPPEVLPAGPLGSFSSAFRTYVKECFSQPYYVLFFAARTLGQLVFTPFNAFVIFYAKSIGLSLEVYGKVIAGTFLISFFLTYFIGVLADKFHPLRVGIVCLFIYLPFAFFGGFFAKTVPVFLVVFVAHQVLSGAYMTATASLQQRMLPRDRFGQFSSAGGLFTSLGFMITQPLVGLVLDLTGQVYRQTLLINAGIGLAALTLLVLVYFRWKKLGGDKAYVAP
ncbi:MAG: MFS transporter [Terrimicrobiaceae bacterium]